MIRIEDSSTDRLRPFANLVPIVEVLMEHGNRLVHPNAGRTPSGPALVGDPAQPEATSTNGFVPSRDDWHCEFQDRLDFGFVRSNFILPKSIVVSDPGDTIFDSNSWCSIIGPFAKRLHKYPWQEFQPHPLLDDSTDPGSPLGNLQPIVEALRATGNPGLDGGSLNEDRVFRLARPIDFALVRARFRLPTSITVDQAGDRIINPRTGVELRGARARP